MRVVAAYGLSSNTRRLERRGDGVTWRSGRPAQRAGRQTLASGSLKGLAAATLVAVAGLSLPHAKAFAAKADAVFTVGNYPVDATDTNAVTAKEKALADGQEAAFRSLLKRIVPVTAYKQLAPLKTIKASELVSGVSVRSERNSSTQYIANLDFVYQADAVRGLLQSHGVPFVEAQAPQITLVPVSRQAPGSDAKPATQAWENAWKGLDLEHTLTPAKLEEFKATIHNDTISMLTNGDDSAQRILAGEYKTDNVVLAIYEPDQPAKKLNVTLVGLDAAGPINLKRSYRVSDGDYTYAGEMAAVVSLGILEGRWKAQRSPQGGAVADVPAVDPGMGGQPVWSAAATPSQGEQVRIVAEFGSLAEWNEMRTQLLETPGVENLEISTVSSSNADISLQYIGGPRALANVLGSRGLRMIDSGAGWTLSASN